MLTTTTLFLNEPNFLVYCSNCGRSFSKVNSLQRHYNREHKETDDADEVEPGIDYDEDVEPDFGCIQCRSYNVHARAFSKSMQVILKACNFSKAGLHGATCRPDFWRWL